MYLFRDRTEAGQKLAEQLSDYHQIKNSIVLGLPRGGVPVAHEIAKKLKLPLDVFLVRKLGTPGQEELAMGAIALGGIQVFNQEIVDYLHIPQDLIDQEIKKETDELNRRNKLYRSNKPLPNLKDRVVILVDDGIATGATMSAAITAIRESKPKQLIVAVPVAAYDTVQKLKKAVTKVICLETPEPFFAIGNWYQDFSQTTSEEVISILKKS